MSLKNNCGPGDAAPSLSLDETGACMVVDESCVYIRFVVGSSQCGDGGDNLTNTVRLVR